MIDSNKLSNFLYRSLKDMSMDSKPKPGNDSIEIEYNLNSYGYRCNEFDNQEILILGCSQTEGYGLPLELTWPYLLSKKMNKDYINLAKGGEGPQAQITKAFKFFEEFYNPKYIFAVFPLTRLEFPLINVNSKNPIKGMGKGMFSNNEIKKYSKFPHFVEEVLPEEFAVFYNVLFIKMLIQYCKTNNIKFIWTYYQELSVEKFSFKNLSDTYFESEFLSYLKTSEWPDCHIEFSNNELFNNAADLKCCPPGHWGLHKHIHIADSMHNMI